MGSTDSQSAMLPTEPSGITAPQQALSVLYLIDAMAPGGTEKHLAALVASLDRERIRPILCTLRPSAMDLSSLSCPVFQAGYTSFGSPTLIRCVRRIREIVADHRVDIVHSFFQDATILGYLATMGMGVVRVGSVRDMGFWRTAGKVLQLRLVFPRYHGFVANSRAVARRFHELDGVPLEKITVIYNGVRLPSHTLVAEPKGSPVVGIVANLNRDVKRVDLFLRAARLIADAQPETRFRIVGDGHLRPRLSELCSALNLTHAVSFCGSVPDPYAEIAQFDVGLLTSDSEGLSNSILEYMAAGVPTVARRVGGNAEVVLDEETGLLIDNDSPSAIANATIRMLSDAAARHRMGEEGRAVAASTFTLAACARCHEEYYARLMCSVREPG